MIMKLELEVDYTAVHLKTIQSKPTLLQADIQIDTQESSNEIQKSRYNEDRMPVPSNQKICSSIYTTVSMSLRFHYNYRMLFYFLFYLVYIYMHEYLLY